MSVMEVFTAASTGIAAVGILATAWTNVRLQRDMLRPRLVAEPAHDEWERSQVVLSIANTGSGPAIDVKYKIVGVVIPRNDHTKITNVHLASGTHIGDIQPGQTRRVTLVDEERVLRVDDPCPPFVVMLGYRYIGGRRWRYEAYPIDITELYSQLAPDLPLHRIADALNGTPGHIGKALQSISENQDRLLRRLTEIVDNQSVIATKGVSEHDG